VGGWGGQNLALSGYVEGMNKETSTGRCAVWDRCLLLVHRKGRFGL